MQSFSFSNQLELLKTELSLQPYPLLFATISGAHLYGFPSPDSDYDIRGVHVLPVSEVVGLDLGPETLEESKMHQGLQLDLVTHDAKKFFSLLLKKNGYVLEQLYSPLVIHTTTTYDQLKAIAKGCITRHHVHHYLGFARTQWRIFENSKSFQVKPLLYVYRVLLTGIHLMETGEVEANLLKLNERFQLQYIDELVAYKLSKSEKSTLKEVDVSFHEREYQRLCLELENASLASFLPDYPHSREALNKLLIQIRIDSNDTVIDNG